MGATTIEWTATILPDGRSLPGYTFNSWVGCQAVSDACKYCYAESWAKRSGLVKWGPGEERRRTSESYWRQPFKWNRIAERDGVRRRVFCCSLADVFDNKADPQWRSDLFQMIEDTPALDWLLLTKRPQNIAGMLWPKWDAKLPDNIWLGTTVENRQEADRRIPALLGIPARIHFVSCEPLLERIHLGYIGWPSGSPRKRDGTNALLGITYYDGDFRGRTARLGWVICGGESGGHARVMNPDWARSLRDQCEAASVPFFMKQMTKKAPIPPDLMVRQFPVTK